VSNSLDAAGASGCDIRLEPGKVVIEDDGDGIADPEFVFAVFLTDKSDSPAKRGRMGRGLKELISACDRAVVEILGRTVCFLPDRTRQEIANTRTRGTRVAAAADPNVWDEAQIAPAAAHLERIIPPPGFRLLINGRQNERPEEIIRFRATLPTVVFEHGRERVQSRAADVVLHRPPAGRCGRLYEMGMRRFAETTAFLASRVLEEPVEIGFYSRGADFTGKIVQADFRRAGNMLRYNVLGGTDFQRPLSRESLETPVHELAHRRAQLHDRGHEKEVERMAGRLGEVIWTHRREIPHFADEPAVSVPAVAPAPPAGSAPRRTAVIRWRDGAPTTEIRE
jgi:hypothetical protein